MPNHIIAIPNSSGLAAFIGKKGSENSITFYNRSVDGNIVTVLAPTSVADKFYALSEILTISDAIVLSTENLDKLFGELVIAAKLLGKKVLLTPENADSEIISNAKLENSSVCEKEALLDAILALKPRGGENGSCRVDIDKAFDVKGIGAVALGFVMDGIINVHDELWHSSGRKVLVRSLQSQDIDVKSAAPGTRIGIGLKNIESDVIEKGSILHAVQHVQHKRLKIRATLTEINKEHIETGKFYGFGSNFSYAMAKIEEVNGDTITLALEKPLSIFVGDGCLLVREALPRIFAAGKVTELL